MTAMGWLFMLASNLFVWGLTAWSFYKVMTVKGEIETPPDTLGG